MSDLLDEVTEGSVVDKNSYEYKSDKAIERIGNLIIDSLREQGADF